MDSKKNSEIIIEDVQEVKQEYLPGLILGIVSIVLAFNLGFIGLIVGIIGLVLSVKHKYKLGKILNIIGVVISVISMIIAIISILLSFFGSHWYYDGYYDDGYYDDDYYESAYHDDFTHDEFWMSDDEQNCEFYDEAGYYYDYDEFFNYYLNEDYAGDYSGLLEDIMTHYRDSHRHHNS